MIKSCIINNYNYEDYIEETIQSALNQTLKFDEIIIVDDGSTDSSCEIIKKYEKYPSVTAILKKNGGQLSAFNIGFEKSTGDIVCFIDSDDYYEAEFLENIIKTFEENPEVDHIFCDANVVDKEGEEVKKMTRYKYPKDIDFGFTLAKTYFLSSWTGNPTSMNAFRRGVLEKILPLDMENEFRRSADRPIVMGCSLVGGKKYYLKEYYVNYRVHGKNMWYGNKNINKRYAPYKEELDNIGMFKKVMEKNKIHHEAIDRLIEWEYTSKPTKTFHETKIYIYLTLMSKHSLFAKCKILFSILKSFIKR